VLRWAALRGGDRSDRDETAGPKRSERWELWGLSIGLLSGVFDLGLFWLLGERLKLSLSASVAVVTALFAATSGALGYVIGRLLQARRRERADARTIRAQLAALEASQQVVLQSEKLAAIGRLAAGVAHEVRNPLGVIRASARMVQEGFSPEDDSHRACQFICEEIDRLNALISSLLAFARPAQLRLARVGLDPIVDRALQLVDEELRRRRVGILRQGPRGLEIEADADLLAQVLLGLLTNAAEAIGDGGSIELRLLPGADELRIEIADSGPGLPPDQAPRLFEPFFTTKPTGTGLGLAMAQRIVQAHRGGLQLVLGRGAGPAGAGACFEIRLPVRGAAGTPGEAQA
jgi:two-component system sensor histidine kinase HydH